MRVLLVEDDPQLGDGLMVGLRQSGFAVDWLKDGEAADRALASEDFDLLVLDLGLPKLAGMELLRRLRGRGQVLPVLILTARDATADKIAGLDSGADDYLVKPVDIDAPQPAEEKINAYLAANAANVDGIVTTAWVPAVTAANSLRKIGDKRIKMVGIDHDEVVIQATR